jgi:hypothetical protein
MPGTPGRAPALLRSRGGLKRHDRVFAHYTDELAAEGEACDDYLITCQHGLACVEPGVCTAVVCDGDIDAPCNGASCAEGLVCNSATERCEPPGEPCDDEERFCEPGQFCDDGTCQTERQSS